MRLSAIAWSSVVVLGISAGCMPQGDPAIGSNGFADNFDRREIGPLWTNTGGSYQVRDGQLWIRGARNHPLWLRRTLPRDCRVEFDARSDSPEGDIKAELFGDGASKAEEASYTATSYVMIFGGWGNSLNVLARMDEHGSDRVVGPDRAVGPPPHHQVEIGHTYHIKLERRGSTVTAWADGQELAHFEDRNPLEGRGHDHFAFNDWEAELTFDNLRITPL